MKGVTIAVALLLAVGADHAMAGSCASGPFLNKNDLSNLLAAGRYACGHTTTPAPDDWDELHSGGTNGGTITTSDGDSYTYTLTAGSTGSVTYNYGTGGTFSYQVTPASGATVTTTPGSYLFCQISPGTYTYTITISTSAHSC
jgi:hypothetical protein